MTNILPFNARPYQIAAMLDGRLSQIRTPLKPQPDLRGSVSFGTILLGQRCVAYRANIEAGTLRLPCAIGDRYWVREAFSLHRAHGQDFTTPANDHGVRWGPWSGLPIAVSPDKTQVAYYRHDFDRSGPPRWRSSTQMPRWVSRFTLTVTDLRVERLQEISHEDAVAEGMGVFPHSMSAQKRFREIWSSIHGPDAWDANPLVVATTFTAEKRNIDHG